MRPLDDMNCHIGGKRYRFLPAQAKPEDMPFLLHLFVALLGMKTIGAFDIESHMNAHDLWHCFEERP